MAAFLAALSLLFSQNLSSETIDLRLMKASTFDSETKDLTLRDKPMILVTDSMGREVKIPKDPKRIVVLTAYAMEMIRLLGGVDRVVGTTGFIKGWVEFIPEAAKLPEVGSSSIPNLETVARLKPDLVLAWKDVPGPQLEEIMGSLGISVLRLDLAAPETLERDVMTLSEILGEDAKVKALKYLSWNQNLHNKLKNTLSSYKGKKPTVLVEHYVNRTIAGPPSACFATTILAGGDNLGKNIPQIFGEMDEEWVIKENPDYFVKLGIFFTVDQRKNSEKITEALKKEILGRPGWDGVTAVREGGVFILDEDLCGGPRGIVGAYTAASRFHKDLVSEAEPVAIKREYVENFLFLPFEP
jgi:iron complex transport system substrate-binding protein